jgi:hypothetical protein
LTQEDNVAKHRLKQRWETLQERRGAILREAGAKLTGLDYMHVYGYGRALWDTSWNSLDWKLGYEDLNASRHSRRQAVDGGWDYSKGVPTHGGHFHPTGELATDWLAFNP